MGCHDFDKVEIDFSNVFSWVVKIRLHISRIPWGAHFQYFPKGVEI